MNVISVGDVLKGKGACEGLFADVVRIDGHELHCRFMSELRPVFMFFDRYRIEMERQSDGLAIDAAIMMATEFAPLLDEDGLPSIYAGEMVLGDLVPG